MSWIAVGVSAGVGALKGMTIDKDREQRQRQLASDTQRFSPWTGLKAGPIQEADPLGSILTYGSQGAQLGAGIKNAGAQKGLMEAQAKWLQNGGSPMYSGAMSTPNLMSPTSPWSLGVNYPRF